MAVVLVSNIRLVNPSTKNWSTCSVGAEMRPRVTSARWFSTWPGLIRVFCRARFCEPI